ncbi:MAG: segregation/condensation protein A [Rhodospirillaceae bacterium]|jgi:segregation and condensation protein A|nr:segregation/condensation protein A [Rhodospirillaceae bacterium]MBT3628502.1 segregation/condensation protein A [Rhodospirillaceae bacterium]MBT3928963.1 segregation/condensation protein A [Rhodospirillaceae bacterium]MBT4427438.1 segregation/condensation protein A [Rhodospirillaceae bacterium]MBT5039938.1 segregation/condensation protein A [Rhodospirillaceae bacterium]
MTEPTENGQEVAPEKVPPVAPEGAPADAAEPDFESGEREYALILDLDGFEGPLDVLLTLTRNQKVDLSKISILELAEQYLAFITRARELKLEIAADYLVMAAWLAYMKSRLLLPEPEGDEEPSGQEMADALAFRLRRLEAMREAAGKLMRRPRLGIDVFAGGAPEGIQVIRVSQYEASLYELLKSYAEHKLDQERGETLQILASQSYSLEAAYRRLGEMLPTMPEWESMARFLPPEAGGGITMRSAVAITFAASLELARQGKMQLRQFEPFGRIYVRRPPEET